MRRPADDDDDDMDDMDVKDGEREWDRNDVNDVSDDDGAMLPGTIGGKLAIIPPWPIAALPLLPLPVPDDDRWFVNADNGWLRNDVDDAIDDDGDALIALPPIKELTLLIDRWWWIGVERFVGVAVPLTLPFGNMTLLCDTIPDGVDIMQEDDGCTVVAPRLSTL